MHQDGWNVQMIYCFGVPGVCAGTEVTFFFNGQLRKNFLDRLHGDGSA